MKTPPPFYSLIIFLFSTVVLSFQGLGQAKNGEESEKQHALIDEYSDELARIDEKIIKYQFTDNYRKLAAAYEEKADLLRDEHLGVAVVYYENAIELYNRIKAKEDAFRLLELISREYIKLDDRKNALKKMYTLLDIYQKEKDTLKIAQSYSAIGSLYADQNENDRALEYMLKALNMAIELKMKVGEAAIRNNIAGVYKDLGKIDLAFENVRIAKGLNQESGNEYWLSINDMMFADLYSELDQMDSARYYLFKSNEYTTTQGDLSDSIVLFRKTGVYYLKVDSVEKALNMFNQGILASRKMGSLKSEANFTHWISELHEKNGEMDLALSFLQIRHDLLDSLSKMERGKRLEEFYVLHKVNALESELSNSTRQVSAARTEADQTRNRLYWLLGVLLVVIIGAIIIFFQYRKQAKSNKHLLELNVKSANIEEEQNDKYAQSNLSDGKKQEILNRLVEFMVNEQMYINQDVNLNMVAEKLGVSRTYLSQVINETYSQNFTAYINSYRINLAKKYLLSTDYDKYSIQGIAEIVGFKSVSAFNASFKKLTGLAPSYYRKNGREV
ncbi:MAG: helix-turn-helix transcriptional regulator [Flavobacteriales bacterium]|nr:helix-turn-helix transcriptional regulator [Flavobacteriales bacterium]